MTACLLYGGMVLPLAIGALVVGVPTTLQSPLSGQVVPVRALVPIGAFMFKLQKCGEIARNRNDTSIRICVKINLYENDQHQK